tara:strand:+ start:423 stop:641 length:219 start_codon:yes stop_codon:yes gene_type:complete
MAFTMKGFTPFYKKSESNNKIKKTYTGKIYESLDAVNKAIKNKDYKKRADGIYKFNFKTETGEISTKTLRKR